MMSATMIEYGGGNAGSKITVGPDGDVWYTSRDFTAVNSSWVSEVSQFDPRSKQTSTFNVPIPTAGNGGMVGQSLPTFITAGPDGNVWFTTGFNAGSWGESTNASLYSINPATHEVGQYNEPSWAIPPSAMASGPDGKLWFGAASGGIDELDPSSMNISSIIPNPPDPLSTVDMKFDAGGNLWFTGYNIHYVVGGYNYQCVVGRVDATSHALSTFAIPSVSSLGKMTIGPDGNVWFLEGHWQGNSLGKLDVATDVITEYNIPTLNSGGGIASGPDGIWFGDSVAIGSSGTGVSEVDVSGQVIESLATYSEVTDLTTGPNGTVWFAETGGWIGEVKPTPLGTVSCTPSAPVYGDSIVLSTHWSAASGTIVPSGRVTFLVGGSAVDTETLDANGDALSKPFSWLSVGDYSIAVSYGGDDNFGAGRSSALSLHVNRASPLGTVSCSPSAPVYGERIVLSTHWSAAGAPWAPPSGAVKFYDGAMLLDTETLDANGDAQSKPISTLSAGDHSITVEYAGDYSFDPGTSSALSLHVDQTSFVGSVSCSRSAPVFGDPVVLSTHWSAAGTAMAPSGTVKFYDGATLLDTERLDANGNAQSKTIWSLTAVVGDHSITVVYAGDDNIYRGTSSALSLHVNRASPLGTVSCSTSAGLRR